jgi:uroporphyrinogen-III synthase
MQKQSALKLARFSKLKAGRGSLTNVKTLLLTRPQAQSRALAHKIDTEFPDKATCLISPLLSIIPIGDLPDLSEFQALLFTSVNGVQAFAALDTAFTARCYCVGSRTAEAAQNAGFNAISANGTGAELISLVAKDLKPAVGPILHIRGEHTAGDVAENLALLDFTVEQAVLYRQHACDLSAAAQHALANGEVRGLPLYSPLTARNLAEILQKNPGWPCDGLTVLCISQNVAAEVQNLALGHVEVSATPDGAGMLSLIGRFLR